MNDLQQQTEARPSIGPVPTEAEMNIFSDTFQKIASAITSASRLQGDFDNLRLQVEQLTKDLENQRQRNRWLDDEIQDIRQARETYKRERDEYQAQVVKLTGENALQAQDIVTFKDKLSRLYDELTKAEHDRDDAMLKVMELEESHKQVSSKLEDVRSLAMEAFGLVEKAKPVPVPEVPEVSYDEPPVIQEPKAPETVMPWNQQTGT